MDTGMLASLLSEGIMHSQWFAALTVFVAINTLLYLTLAIVKLLPKAYLSDWVDRRDRRGETRGIDPNADRRATPIQAGVRRSHRRPRNRRSECVRPARR